jgi:hypothetical protein
MESSVSLSRCTDRSCSGIVEHGDAAIALEKNVHCDPKKTRIYESIKAFSEWVPSYTIRDGGEYGANART